MKNIQSNTWCVYRHISPSNKVYIGITHYEDPTLRWGPSGCYYRKGSFFYNAIKKYGWNNITHEILFHPCTEELAKKLEIAFIKYYKDLNLSYNMTVGGDGHNFGLGSSTLEYRRNSSKKFREGHPDYDKQQYEKHKEKRKKNAVDYYYNNRETILEKKKNNLDAKEKARIRAAKWREAHPNYMKEYMKEYNANKKLQEV